MNQEPDPELHPQEYLEGAIDRIYEAADRAAFLIMDKMVQKVREPISQVGSPGESTPKNSPHSTA